MSHKVFAVVVCVVALPGLVKAQPHHDCEWLLRYGIYDYHRCAIDRNTVEHLRSLLTHSRAETVEQFQAEAGAAGLSLFGLLDLNLRGKSARKDFRGWKEEFLATTSHDLLQNERFVVEVKKISPVLMDAVKHCMSQSHPGKLLAWVEPSPDDLTFTLNFKYDRLPSEKDGPILESVTFTTSPPGQLLPLNEAEAQSIKQGHRVKPAGIAVTFQRPRPSVGITVTVNTTNHGSKTIFIAGVDPFQQKSAELKAVELQLTAATTAAAQAEAELSAARSSLRIAEAAHRPAEQVAVSAATALDVARQRYDDTHTRVSDERWAYLRSKYAGVAQLTGKPVDEIIGMHTDEMSAVWINIATNRGLFTRKQELAAAESTAAAASKRRDERVAQVEAARAAIVAKEKDAVCLKHAQEVLAQKAERIRRQLAELQHEPRP